jgi:hypothetical protein
MGPPRKHKKRFSPIAVAVGLGCALAWTGCAPRLEARVKARKFFVSNQACTTGPFEIQVKTTGHRWGEKIALTIHAPRPLSGKYSLYINDEKAGKGRFGTPLPRFARPACTPHRPPSKKSRRAPTQGVGRQHRPPTAPLGRPLREVAPQRGQQLKNRAHRKPNRFVVTLSRVIGRAKAPRYTSCQHTDPHPNKLPPGATARFVIWSDRPLALRNVIFEVTHTVYTPPLDQRGKWRAHVRKHIRFCKKQRARRRQKMRNQRPQRVGPPRKLPVCKKWKAITVGARVVSQPVYYNGRPVGVRRSKRGGLTYRLPARITRPCVCWKKPHDASCWGSEGKRAFQTAFWKRVRARLTPDTRVTYSINRISIEGHTLWRFNRKTRYYCVRHLADRGCWGPGGYPAFRSRILARTKKREQQYPKPPTRKNHVPRKLRPPHRH